MDLNRELSAGVRPLHIYKQMMAPTEIRHITARAGIECRSSLSTVTRMIYAISANISRFSRLIVSNFASAAYSLGPDPGEYASVTVYPIR